LAPIDLALLFRRYQDDLLRFLMRRVSCPETAADIAQESFLRLMRPAASGQVRDVRAFLFTTAANLARDHHRHARIARTIDDGDDFLASTPDPAPAADVQAIDRERLARARDAMAALPERTRIAFEMHRLGGYTQTEIAREMGVSVTLVWRMVHQAYAQLRTALRDDDDA
jgi:RNA polymerase sigma-70 factor (ECF subfamily)